MCEDLAEGVENWEDEYQVEGPPPKCPRSLQRGLYARRQGNQRRLRTRRASLTNTDVCYEAGTCATKRTEAGKDQLSHQAVVTTIVASR